jgi:hypothetical protein
LSASAATCSSRSVLTMGYSFDSSSDTTVVDGESIDTTVSAPAGTHMLHVKAWSGGGISCVADVQINVASGSPSDGSLVCSLLCKRSRQPPDPWRLAENA